MTIPRTISQAITLAAVGVQAMRELAPVQAIRAVLDRDFSDRLNMASFAHDAAEGLNEFEAENDGLDGGELPDHPGYPAHLVDTLDSGPAYKIGRDIIVGEEYCLFCGEQLGESYHACPVVAAQHDATFGPDADHAEALERDRILGPYQHPEQYADPVGGTIPAQHASSVASENPADDDSPAEASLPHASAGFHAELIAEVLDLHEPEVSRLSGRVDCNPGTEGCPMWPDHKAWRNHVAPLIAERIEKARTPAGFTFGDLAHAARIIRDYSDEPGWADENLRLATLALANRLADAADVDPNP